MAFTVSNFMKNKENGEKITMLTAYDYSTAKLFNDEKIDAILVGDSLGMVMLGYEDTLKVTMEDMIHHTKAVARACDHTFVVGDMPFMSYQTSVYDAVVNAGRLVKEAGAQAVKLEGGAIYCEHIRAIVNAQIPVMGHIGLTPQSVNVFGGFKVQGKNEDGARQLIEDAKKLEEAGAFAIVLECIPSQLAKLITESVSIPTIGIGAGVHCDGQILVYQDMLNMYSQFKPKFVKTFSDVGSLIREGVSSYITEVKDSTFPDESHSFNLKEETLKKLY